jgi:hypothetical protein
VPPYLLRRQAQPIGDVVLAAVSHDKHLQPPRELPDGMPIRLLTISG